MTIPSTCDLTYTGPVASGSVSLPSGGRRSFTRGQTLPFSAADAASLGPEWEGERLDPGTGVEAEGVDVPLGTNATLLEDAAGGLVLVEGLKFGTPAEVLAAASTPERARALLDHERTLTRPRKTVVAQLTKLAGTDPAGAAGTTQEA